MERSSIVEFNHGKIFVIRGHWRSLEVIKGQMEVKNQNVKKSTIWALLERPSVVEFNFLKIFVIKGHWRSIEVIKGQGQGQVQG